MNQTLKLPKNLKEWVHSQVKTRGLQNTESYIVQLVKAEQKRQALAQLITELDKADQSGPGVEITYDIWKARQDALFAKLKKQRLKKPSHAKNH